MGSAGVRWSDQRSDGVRDGADAETAAHHHHHWARSRLAKRICFATRLRGAREKAPLIARLRERLVVPIRTLVVVAQSVGCYRQRRRSSSMEIKAQSDTAANRIGIRPISCGHRLVDDDDWWRCRRVKGVKSRLSSKGCASSEERPGSTSHESAGKKSRGGCPTMPAGGGGGGGTRQPSGIASGGAADVDWASSITMRIPKRSDEERQTRCGARIINAGHRAESLGEVRSTKRATSASVR